MRSAEEPGVDSSRANHGFFIELALGCLCLWVNPNRSHGTAVTPLRLVMSCKRPFLISSFSVSHHRAFVAVVCCHV